MAKSNRTKQCNRIVSLLSIIHFLCLFGPLLYFIPYGYMIGEPVEKVSLTLTLILSVILAVISLLTSVTTRASLQRSMMWILIIGIMFCLKQIETFIWIMAVLSIIDDLIITKLLNKYKMALISNKELDKR